MVFGMEGRGGDENESSASGSCDSLENSRVRDQVWESRDMVQRVRKKQ